jgi:hypothetical protein
MPHIEVALDATVPVLERSPAGSAALDMCASYAQFQPGRSLLIAYEATSGGRSHDTVALRSGSVERLDVSRPGGVAPVLT